MKNGLFTLCGLGHKQDDFPNIVLTEEAKAFFSRSELMGAINIIGESTICGQGLVGIAWLGKNEVGEDTFFVDLLPAFNKDDHRLKEDKYKVRYDDHEYAYTNEPLGGNSGRNHEKLINVITARIQKAYLNREKEKEKEILKKYGNCYQIKDNQVVMDKTKLFGMAVIKGDNDILLSDIRMASANINLHSVIYNPEFLLINYFFEDIEDTFQLEYFIRRKLPIEIGKKFGKAFISQLPLETDNTLRKSQSNNIFQHMIYVERWEEICNNPLEKNILLKETLVKFCSLKSTKIDKIKETLKFIKTNMALLYPGYKQKQLNMLKELLSSPSKYNQKSILVSAIDTGKTEALKFLLQTIRGQSLDELFIYAVKNNYDSGVELIFQENKIKNITRIESIFESAKRGHFAIMDMLESPLDVLDKDSKNSAGDKFIECISMGIINLGKKGDYINLKKYMVKFNVNLNLEVLDFVLNKFNGKFIEETAIKILETHLLFLLEKFDFNGFKWVSEKYYDILKKIGVELIRKLRKELSSKLLCLSSSNANLIKIKEFKDSFSELFNKLISNEVDSVYKSLLNLAIMHDKIEIAEFYIKNKANPNICDELNNNSVLLAAGKGNLKIVKLLLKHGADYNAENLMQLTFMDILKFNSVQEIKDFENECSEIKLNVNKILFQACESGNQRIVKYMLERKPDLEIQTKNSETALQIAFKNGYYNIANILILQGAKVDLVIRDAMLNSGYQSPCFLATLNRHNQHWYKLAERHLNLPKYR